MGRFPLLSREFLMSLSQIFWEFPVQLAWQEKETGKARRGTNQEDPQEDDLIGAKRQGQPEEGQSIVVTLT